MFNFKDMEIRSVDIVNDDGAYSLLEIYSDLRSQFKPMFNAIDEYGSSNEIVSWGTFLDDMEEFCIEHPGLSLCVSVSLGMDSCTFTFGEKQ